MGREAGGHGADIFLSREGGRSVGREQLLGLNECERERRDGERTARVFPQQLGMTPSVPSGALLGHAFCHLLDSNVMGSGVKGDLYSASSTFT